MADLHLHSEIGFSMCRSFMEKKRPNITLFTSFLNGWEVPPEVGLVHRSSLGQVPFLPPPMTHIGTSSGSTKAR